MRGLATLCAFGLTACQVVFPLEEPPPQLCDHPDLALCLSFDDDLEDGVAADLSVDKLDATLENIGEVDREPGEKAADILAEGSIVLDHRDAFDREGPFTVELWARWTTSQSLQMLLDNDSQYSIKILPVVQGPEPFGFVHCSNHSLGDPPNDFQEAAADQPLDGEWHHIACVIDGTKLNIYIDGNRRVDGERDSPGPNFVAGVENLTIGRPSRSNSLEPPFLGQVDNIRFWNRALVEDEIEAFADGEK